MPEIRTSYERSRGCGFRKGGGTYLVTDEGKLLQPCGRLPLVLDICPTCGQGIKFSRSPGWVDPALLFEGNECRMKRKSLRSHSEILQKIFGGPFGAKTSASCLCPLDDPSSLGRSLLMWVGEKFYPSPMDWLQESQRQGISRRIASVPRGFIPGETWILVAHKKVNIEGGQKPQPAVFHLFRPDRIEYVVSGQESEEELAKIEKRGISLVKVIPVDSDGNILEQPALDLEGDLPPETEEGLPAQDQETESQDPEDGSE